MVSDLFRSQHDTDVGLVNSGCLRANGIFPKGQIKLKVIAEILPILDNVVRKKMPG